MVNVVLVEPEIPQNTGNICRTCAATGSRLHLVGPLGFHINDKYLRRAGMDYLAFLDWYLYADMADFLAKNSAEKSYYATVKGVLRYDMANYSGDTYLFFGGETRGLDASIIEANRDRTIRIPMESRARSLNLSNSVAIVIYEALRRNNFDSLR